MTVVVLGSLHLVEALPVARRQKQKRQTLSLPFFSALNTMYYRAARYDFNTRTPSLLHPRIIDKCA
jgi:hypothetical protein